MKYCKKPIVVEAFQMTEECYNDTSVWPNWLIDALKNTPNEEVSKVWKQDIYIGPSVYFDDSGTLLIRTLEGDMKTSFMDYIIKGVNGELYPCKSDIFEKTYVSVISKVEEFVCPIDKYKRPCGYREKKKVLCPKCGSEMEEMSAIGFIQWNCTNKECRFVEDDY